MLVLLASCSSRSATPVDAPPIDAMQVEVDASIDAPDDAARVEVVAYGIEGLVDPSAIAIFRDASGATVKHGPVDTNGHAFGFLPAGGSVIVLQAQNDPQTNLQRYVHITVVRGVVPGDRLATGATERTAIEKTGATSTMHASYTAIGSSGPFLMLACGSSSIGNPRPLTFHSSCTTPTFAMLSLADDAATSVRKYVWQDTIPYVADGAFTIPNTWQPLPRNSTTFDNVPASLQRVFATLYANIEGGQFELDRQGVEIPSPGSHSVAMMFAPVDIPTLIVAATVQGISIFERYAVVTRSPQTVAIDWASLQVPHASGVQQSASGVAWTQTGTGQPDGRAVIWSSEWTDPNNVTRFASYELLEDAATSPSSTLPALPDEYADDDPTRHAGQLRGAGVRYFDYDNIAGYAGARAHGPDLVWVENHFRGTAHRAHVSFERSLP